MERPLRKLAAKLFDLHLLNLGAHLDVYLLSEKVTTVFIYIRGKGFAEGKVAEAWR